MVTAFDIDASTIRLTGGSGTRVIIAPFPTEDVRDKPIIFVADTLAKILDPQGKSNGDALRTANGIEQRLIEITASVPPSQFVRS